MVRVIKYPYNARPYNAYYICIFKIDFSILGSFSQAIHTRNLSIYLQFVNCHPTYLSKGQKPSEKCFKLDSFHFGNKFIHLSSNFCGREELQCLHWKKENNLEENFFNGGFVFSVCNNFGCSGIYFLSAKKCRSKCVSGRIAKSERGLHLDGLL